MHATIKYKFFLDVLVLSILLALHEQTAEKAFKNWL